MPIRSIQLPRSPGETVPHRRTTITATGTDGLLELISGSDSISFSSDSDNVGVLRTSNPTFDGEGDVVLLFSGAITRLDLTYQGGDGANGIFYGFAINETRAVPEPTAGALSALLALIPLTLRKRRVSIMH